MSRTDRRVLHIASGDRWGGAEAQLHTLLTRLESASGWRAEAVLLNDLELAQRLRDAGIPVTVFAEGRLNTLQLYRAIASHLDSRRPTVVHTHRQKENILGGLAAWRFGIASLRTVHGATEHPPRGLRRLHKHALFGLDHWIGAHLQQRLIAVSEDLHQQLACQYPPARLVTIENGIDIDAIRSAAAVPVELGDGSYPDLRRQGRLPPDRHPPGTRHPSAGDPPQGCHTRTWHVGIVGRLDPVKRVDLFLDMAAQLIAAGRRDWRFHVFGDGALGPALRQQAATLGITAQVEFHGHRRDIAACLAALDALVMCSDHEGLPMTALEAIAVGTPVLAHAVGGLVAVLEQRCGGLLVDDHRPAAYAAALEQLLCSDLPALMNAGQARLEHRYSAAGNARAIGELYDRLAGSEG